MKQTRLSHKGFRRIILATAALIIIITIAISYYLIGYKAQQPITTGLPTPKPTATPTPVYMPFLKKPANYVGKIVEIKNPTEIVILRDDESKLILNLKPNIPIYVVDNTSPPYPKVETYDQSILKLGDTISIYTQDNSIVAIFLFNE